MVHLGVVHSGVIHFSLLDLTFYDNNKMGSILKEFYIFLISRSLIVSGFAWNFSRNLWHYLPSDFYYATSKISIIVFVKRVWFNVIGDLCHWCSLLIRGSSMFFWCLKRLMGCRISKVNKLWIHQQQGILNINHFETSLN